MKQLWDALETRLCEQLQHPQIVGYHGLCVAPPRVCLVFEICELGSLYHLLPYSHVSHRAALSVLVCVRHKVIMSTAMTPVLCCTVQAWHPRRRKQMAVDAASAIEYLHGLDPPVIHRDINVYKRGQLEPFSLAC